MQPTNNSLIEENMPLVYYIVSHYYPTFIRDEDVIQSGMLGLCKAANTWDSERGLFSTYAGRCIRNEINQEFIRRKPDAKTVSLSGTNGDNITLEEALVGEEDVPSTDYAEFRETLTAFENEILDMESMGYSSDEMSKVLGLSVSKVRQTSRLIKAKWGKFNNG